MVSLPQFHKQPPAAACGSCTACCQIPGVPELGKPYYARCYHLTAGCSIYNDRPERCRLYRCAWHLNLLGERTDRRPDQCGVLFQFDSADGKWFLGIYELTPGAADSDRARYLRDIILSSKRIAHLAMGSPPVIVYRFGADVPTDYPISDRYDHVPSTAQELMRRTGTAYEFAGATRAMLDPKPLPDLGATG